MAELGVWTNAEMLAGLAGGALGISGLLGVSQTALIACASFIFGAALVLEARANVRIKDILTMYRQEHPMSPDVARQVDLATTSLQVPAGLGVVVLGIIALASTVSTTLSLGAVRVVGVVMFVRGSAAIVARMLSLVLR